MTDQPTAVDLDSADLAWGEHQIAGAEKPAGIVMLRANPEQGTRTVIVRFPDGWTRDAVGHQPAGEEMVVLDGALSISGLTCGAGQALVVEPKATRAATSTLDGTRAVVWFSGAGGGWADGEAADAGSTELLTVDAALSRGPRDGLVGSLAARDDVAGAVFGTDVEIVWPGARRWAFVPAGTATPDVTGLAIIHTF
ncbi:hypothetical protein [Aeromicrobium sp. UC242_57]|uniref:hypothetical protein n=1 Tax=Aeromicrobium sp. UC242_57 TaxID=3374624 RepID=UPI0037926895